MKLILWNGNFIPNNGNNVSLAILFMLTNKKQWSLEAGQVHKILNKKGTVKLKSGIIFN
jgi:hypothetical protein